MCCTFEFYGFSHYFINAFFLSYFAVTVAPYFCCFCSCSCSSYSNIFQSMSFISRASICFILMVIVMTMARLHKYYKYTWPIYILMIQLYSTHLMATVLHTSLVFRHKLFHVCNMKALCLWESIRCQSYCSLALECTAHSSTQDFGCIT